MLLGLGIGRLLACLVPVRTHLARAVNARGGQVRMSLDIKIHDVEHPVVGGYGGLSAPLGDSSRRY
jgi:hypothetical protein